MVEKAVLKSPIFIFGFPRSGTTLLRSILGQHSQITLVNEPEIIWALRNAGYDIDSKFSRDESNTLIDKLKRIGLCRKHLERNRESIKTAFLNCEDTLSFREVFERLLPKPSGNQMAWGEKSLNNLFFIKDLIRIYPEAVLIHIVRDARSVLLSYYQKKRRLSSDEVANIKKDLQVSRLSAVLFFAEQAMLWQYWMSIAQYSQKVISASNWIEIRFEDFIKRPQELLISICDKIGVEYEDQMIDPASRLSDPVLATRAAYAHKKLSQDIDESRAHAYNLLPNPFIWIVERQAKSMMRHFGYHLIRPSLHPWQFATLTTVLTGYRWKLKYNVNSHLKRRGVSH